MRCWHEFERDFVVYVFWFYFGFVSLWFEFGFVKERDWLWKELVRRRGSYHVFSILISLCFNFEFGFHVVSNVGWVQRHKAAWVSEFPSFHAKFIMVITTRLIAIVCSSVYLFWYGFIFYVLPLQTCICKLVITNVNASCIRFVSHLI